MSLDVYLMVNPTELAVAADYLQDGGFDRAAEYLRLISRSESITLYDANITHNLGKMADAAGLYEALWRPDENGLTTAAQLIEPLRNGLNTLRKFPEQFSPLNPSNGWGNYDGLVEFVTKYLEACEKYPFAAVEVSR